MSKLALVNVGFALATWPLAFLQIKAANLWVAQLRPDDEFFVWLDPTALAAPVLLGLAAAASGWFAPEWASKIQAIGALLLVVGFLLFSYGVWAYALSLRV